MSNVILSSILIGYLILIVSIIGSATYIVVNYIAGYKTPKKKSRKHLRVIK